MPPFGSAGKCLREESVGCGPGLRPGPGGSPEPSFGRKLLRLAQASSKVPSTEKCSLDNKALTFSCDRTAGEKLRGDIAFEQPVTVLGEGYRIPHRVLDAEPDKPAEQRIMVEPLDQWARSGEAAGSLPGAEPRLPPSAARSNLGRAAGELDCPGEARDPTSTVVQSRAEPEVRIHFPPARSLVRTLGSDRRNPPINGVKVGWLMRSFHRPF